MVKHLARFLILSYQTQKPKTKTQKPKTKTQNSIPRLRDNIQSRDFGAKIKTQNSPLGLTKIFKGKIKNNRFFA